MNRDDIQKLLGGYATGTLTPEEQRALFEAALTDQELFDALAREEALRDVLSDGAARAHLLAAMDNAPAAWYRAWWRPMVVMAAALTVVVGVAVWERSREPKPVQVAKVELPRFQPPVAPSSVAPPTLPLPPEVKTARPAEKLPLPEAAPPVAPPRPQLALPAAAAPPPPPPGSSIGDLARQQFQPAQQSQQTQQVQQAQQVPVRELADAFPSQTLVPVHGTVTDASGAAVASANIVVKSLTSGTMVNTSTNERGEFSAAEIPGNTYEISASKAGFQTATVKDIPPLDGTPAAVSLKLNVASTAEAVEVTAANVQLQTRAAATVRGAGFGGGAMPAMKAKKAEVAPAISYQLLRIEPGSDPVSVPPDGSVPAGSSLTLRITPAADGYLRVVEGKRTIANPQVTHGIVSDTPLPSFDKRGRVELKVYFSPEAGESKQQPAPLTIVFRVQ
jgi:hypothetical protein